MKSPGRLGDVPHVCPIARHEWQARTLIGLIGATHKEYPLLRLQGSRCGANF